jgi:hypothetical protein
MASEIRPYTLDRSPDTGLLILSVRNPVQNERSPFCICFP